VFPVELGFGFGCRCCLPVLSVLLLMTMVFGKVFLYR
jgi:hypothetical protein